jgi:PmbA protein
MSPENEDLARVETTLSLVRRNEIVEVFLENAVSSSITVVDGEAESSEERVDHGIGLRLFREQRVGFAYTSDLSPEGLSAAVEQARALSLHGRREPENRPPEAGPPVAVTPAPADDTSGHPFRLEAARRMEAAARDAVPGTVRTRASTVTASRGNVFIAHSRGLRRAWSWARAWGSLEIVVERSGVRQTGFKSDWASLPSGLAPEEIGRSAAGRALDKFGAERPSTTRSSVILAPDVTATLFETLATALSGKAVLRGRSLFADRVGQQVASTAVTLTDDGAREDGFSAAPFDGEGTPSSETVLIQAGVLRGFLHDTYTGAHLGSASTGHSVRDSYTGPPGVGTRNLCLLPSGKSRDEVLSAVEEGIQVDEVMGLDSVDPVTGDFSLGALGRQVRGGCLGRPLERFAISGSILDLLASVEAVADDLRFMPGGCGGSTVLVRDVTVSGQ